MGAINYKTSDYITIGVKPYDYDDFFSDKELIEEISNYTDDIESGIYDYISDCYECDLENIKAYLEKLTTYYFNICIEYGYYEGFSINIEYNFPTALDGYSDRAEANKEITKIKHFLINCAGCGMVECFPGWCTKYSDYKQTIKAINAAVKTMRDEIKNTLVWSKIKEA